MTLKVVVLPAPFGPMTPTISCGLTSSEMSVRAWMPPNALLTLVQRQQRQLSGRAHARPPQRESAERGAVEQALPAHQQHRRSAARRTRRTASPPGSADIPAASPAARRRPARRAPPSSRRESRRARSRWSARRRNCRARYRRGDARTARRQIAATAAPKPNAPTLIAVALRPTRPAAVSSSRTARISSQTRDRSRSTISSRMAAAQVQM